MFSSKLLEIHNREWNLNLATKPKLRSYVTFKENYSTEDYVKYCLSRKKRSILAQFRIGILPIALETGRFKGIDVNERYCKLCSENTVESEKHLLCHCPLYAELRQTFYEEVSQTCNQFISMSDDEKFVHLLKYEWKLTSNFLNSAWSLRTQKLYLNSDN